MKIFLYTLEGDGKCGLKTVKHFEKVSSYGFSDINYL